MVETSHSSLNTSFADSYSNPLMPIRFAIAEMSHQSGFASPAGGTAARSR